ncbi:BapA/Bap/LapF family large adhesin [Vreelandella venusta]|uniref:Bacterial Ig domain-containing protein n=1 Tax=Vreelandella venusta TaxID=44935 RepID=A0ABX2BFE9_9GAMM|nr:hypothetical protein [Halomonas venusta]
MAITRDLDVTASDLLEIEDITVGESAEGNFIDEAASGDTGNLEVQSITFNGTEFTPVNGEIEVVGEYGTLVINTDGSYTYTPDAEAGSSGVDSFTVDVVDTVTNEVKSANINAEVALVDVPGEGDADADLDAPDAPTAEFNADGDMVTGDAEPSSTVTVYDENGEEIGTAIADAETGSYSVELDPALVDGEEVTVTATDGSGNESEPTTAIAPDSTAPDAPTAEFNADGDMVTGDAEPGSTVTVYDGDDNVLGTATADAETGSYSVELDPALVDGEEVTVTATDGSGNESEPTTATAPDSTAPDAPTAEFNADGDMVTGDAEPSSTVTVYDGDDNVLGTATADAETGSYSVELDPALADGEEVTVTATDGSGNESEPTPVTAPDTTAPNLPGVTIGNGDAFLTTDDLDEDGNVEVTIDLTDTNAEIGDTLTVNGVETTLTEEHVNAEEVVTEVVAPEGGGILEVTAHLADAVGNISDPGTASATALIDGEATANLGNQTSLDYTPDSTSEVQVIDLLDSFPEDAGTAVIVGENEDFNAFSGDLEVEVSQVGLLAVAGAFRVDVYDADGNLVHTAATAGSPLVGDVAGLGILGLTDDGALTTTVTGLEPGQYQVIVRSDESALNQLVGDLTLSELGDSGVVLGEENQEVVLGAVEDALNGTVPVLDLLGLGLGTVVVGILEPVLDTTTELGAGELVDTIVGGLNDLGLTYLVDEVLDAVADALLTETLTLLEQTEITTMLTEQGLEGDGIAEGTVDTGAGVVGSVITEVANSSGQTVQLESGTATIAGLYGDLVINEDGSYTYTANGDIASLNQQETFTYTVSDGDSQAEAELTVTIEGEIPFSASDDTATIDIEWTNVTDNDFHQDEGAVTVLTFLTSPYEGEEFEIEQNMELSGVVIASATLTAGSGGSLNIQQLVDGDWVTAHSETFSSLASLGEVARIDISTLDLEPGTYRVQSDLNGLAGELSIDGSFAATYLDQFESAFVPVSGNLLDNDEAIGASLEILEPDTGDYVEIGVEPITIEGDYGSLTVDANGNYSYTPNGDLEHFTEPHSEVFVYQLTHPNGSTSGEATLTIELKAVDGEASQLDDVGIAALSTFSLSDMDFGDDAEELVFPESEDSNEDEEQVTSATDGVEEMAMGDFSEPQNPLDDEFDQTLMV